MAHSGIPASEFPRDGRHGEDRYESEPLCRYPVDFIMTAVVADFDGDGQADLLCATPAGLFLFKGSPQGAFDEPPRHVWAPHPGLKDAMVLQRQMGRRLGQILVEKGFVSEPDLLKALSAQLDVPYVTLRPGLFDPPALALLDKEIARRLEVLPLFRVHDTLTVATRDPQDVPTFDEVASRTGCRVRTVLARRETNLRRRTTRPHPGRPRRLYLRTPQPPRRRPRRLPERPRSRR